MTASYFIGIAGMLVLVVAWYLVQVWWKRTFAGEIDDEDVLAARGGCGNCGCGSVCQRVQHDIE